MLLGWRPSLALMLEDIARLEAIAIRLETIARFFVGGHC